MRHAYRGNQLGRPTNQAKALYRGLAAEVLARGRIQTTLAKAKAVRGEIDRLVNFGKKDSVVGRRQIVRFLGGDRMVGKISEVAKKYPDRNSGYTRIIRLGPRLADTTEMVVLELVEGKVNNDNKTS